MQQTLSQQNIIHVQCSGIGMPQKMFDIRITEIRRRSLAIAYRIFKTRHLDSTSLTVVRVSSDASVEKLSS